MLTKAEATAIEELKEDLAARIADAPKDDPDRATWQSWLDALQKCAPRMVCQERG